MQKQPLILPGDFKISLVPGCHAMVNFFNKKIDMNELLKQTWESFAIQGEIVTGLSDMLKKLIQIDLHYIAEKYGIKQLSKISNLEIIARLLKLMTDRKKIEEILMVASPDEFDLFLKILDMDSLDIDEMSYESYAFPTEYGIIFSFYHEERRYLVVPDEIKDIFRNINKAVFTKHRERYQLFCKYIKALCNFYGAFEPEQFINIFNTFNRDSTDLAEFNKIYQKLILKRQDFFNHGKYILGEYFGNVSYDEMDSFVEKIKDKPYYIPGKEELLKRSDDYHFEMTLKLTALKDYILNNMCKNEEIVDSLIKNIELLCFTEHPLYEVIYEFKRNGLLFESTKQLNILISLLTDVYNNTRRWGNRGYTAKEISENFNENAFFVTGIPIGELDDVIFKRVGRNDPCPCGSGKKYKKCCAR